MIAFAVLRSWEWLRDMATANAHPLVTGDQLRSVSRALAILDPLAAIPNGQTAQRLLHDRTAKLSYGSSTT
jgi:hypothetical protein